MENTSSSSFSTHSSPQDLKSDATQLDPVWVSTFIEKLSIQPTLKDSCYERSCTIHRVPHSLRRLAKDGAYDPQVISIGPFHYHRRKDQLKLMEQHKLRYLKDILAQQPEVTIEQLLLAVKMMEAEARTCYSEVINLDSNSFVEMMMLDGCFILELFRKNMKEEHYDFIIKLDWLGEAVSSDLILLENQIPFFVLQRLYDLICFKDTSAPLQQLALPFFGRTCKNGNNRRTDPNVDIKHLLHLIHNCYSIFPRENNTSKKEVVAIPSAFQLKDAGVKFRKRGDNKGDWDFLCMRFEKGVLEIPEVQFWDKQFVEFYNLIAFEQCYLYCQNRISSYIFFMACLIKTDKDVDVLSKQGIISSNQGIDVALFNHMLRGVIMYDKHYYLSPVCKKVNKFIERPWVKLKASLARDYFSNPWAIVVFLGSVFLLLVTTTQTIFAVFPRFAVGK